MIRRRGVARRAVRQTRVVKAGIFEVACILMTGATRPCKMVGGCTVTGRTILPANRGMVEVGVLEVAGVLVTGRAGTAPMIGWRAMASATIRAANG